MPDAFSLAADELDETADVSGILKYYDDPAGFAREAIAWPPRQSLAPYQAEVLGLIPAEKRVSVRGPHGLGKTTTTAFAILWFALTRDAAGRDWKCVTTAGAWRQLTHYLWPEIKKWARRIRWDVLGIPPLREGRELLVLSMKLRHGEAFAAASNKPELIEGAHGDSVMYVFDESKAIIADTFDAAEGAFSGASEDKDLEAFALAMSTPGEPNGRFYDIHRRAPGLDDWHARHVTLEEAIAAGRVAPDWAERRKAQWGADSAVYNNRVLGEFWSSDEDGVIPLSWIEAANERWHTWDDAGRPEQGGPHIHGTDVARSGTDKTIIALRDAWVIKELRESSRETTMATAGRVAGLLNADPKSTAVVDVIGIGSGVYDRLREQGLRAEAFNASTGTRRKDASGEFGFPNCLTGDARVRPIGRLLRIYRSRHEGPLFRVKTAGGDDFTATPNHKVLTRRGWVAVKSLNVGDQLCDASPGKAAHPAVGPEVDNVPPSLGEVYRAADRLFGSERVQRCAVNFHGDRPASEVDVVTVDGDLLAIRPTRGQHLEEADLIRALLGQGFLLPEGALAERLGPGDGYVQVGAVLPDHSMPARPGDSLKDREAVEGEVVGFGHGAHLDAVLPEQPGNHLVADPEFPGEPLDGLSGTVTADDVRLVGQGRAADDARLGDRARRDPVFAENAPDHIRVNFECPGERVNGLAGRVAADSAFAVDVKQHREPDSLGVASWLDAALEEDVANPGPVGAVELAQRCERLSGAISLDEVIDIELGTSAAHVDPFVYTLETSTGAYRSSSVVHRNCRSASAWNLRELLDPSRGAEVALPPDDELTGDLTAAHWRVTSGGKIQVELKEEIKKRIGRSPDKGDAAIIAMWGSGVSWAEAYGMTECTGCEALYPEGAEACPSCGLPAPERKPEPAAEPERSPEAGLKETQPHNPWAEVYGKRGGR